MDNSSTKNACPFSGKEQAIQNLGGMTWLYDKHLHKFKSIYANSAAEIRSNLIQGNFKDARLLVHSVKGLSGTLGLHRLYSASSYLEKAIINSDSKLEELLSYYELCLNEVLASDKN